MKLPSIPLLILDTETTGFVPVIHRVIEYACAVAKDGKIVKEYEQLLSIEKNDIPTVVQVLTQIRPKDLEGKPTFGEIFETIEAMLTPGTVVVGQNIPFDLRMLKGEGWDMTDSPWIDTAMLASIVFPELKSYSLGYMSEVLGLTHEPKHRALGDVRATVEMLSLCTERLEQLPAADLDAIKALAARGPAGYRMFFESMEPSGKPRSRLRSAQSLHGGRKKPDWLSLRKHAGPKASDRSIPATTFEKVPVGSVGLAEESFCSETLASILAGAKRGTIVAVKNLDAVLRRTEIKEDIVILPSPDFLLSKESAERFLAQQTFTADELTLAIKLHLYQPSTKSDLPVHGDEYAVWAAKLAGSKDGPEYGTRRKKLGSAIVLTSHHELVTIAAADSSAFTKSSSLVIDDASMLEDTATSALGWTCLISTLRAAATGHDHLTKCVDLVELWAERTRNGMDLRYLAPSDLEDSDVLNLRKIIADLLAGDLPHAARRALTDLSLILVPENIAGRITWIESFQDGSKAIKAVPEKIAELLADCLYSRIPTTLLVPQKSLVEQEAIVPSSVEAKTQSLAVLPVPDFSISQPIGAQLDSFVKSDKGKTVLLVSSKRMVEDLYIKNAEEREKAGCTFLCQGFNGGQSRMQAEFAVAPAPVVMILTPWMYETMELPAGTITKLVIQTLPFDHPSHPVFSRRANRYRDSFSGYSLPRLKHRLFRLIRTFVRHAISGGEIIVLDDRLRNKPYGRIVGEYLRSLSPIASKPAEGQMSLL